LGPFSPFPFGHSLYSPSPKIHFCHFIISRFKSTDVSAQTKKKEKQKVVARMKLTFEIRGGGRNKKNFFLTD
jgi:hypothetical protein